MKNKEETKKTKPRREETVRVIVREGRRPKITTRVTQRHRDKHFRDLNLK